MLGKVGPPEATDTSGSWGTWAVIAGSTGEYGTPLEVFAAAGDSVGFLGTSTAPAQPFACVLVTRSKRGVRPVVRMSSSQNFLLSCLRGRARPRLTMVAVIMGKFDVDAHRGGVGRTAADSGLVEPRRAMIIQV
jgi:hypothetical protein